MIEVARTYRPLFYQANLLCILPDSLVEVDPLAFPQWHPRRSHTLNTLNTANIVRPINLL